MKPIHFLFVIALVVGNAFAAGRVHETSPHLTRPTAGHIGRTEIHNMLHEHNVFYARFSGESSAFKQKFVDPMKSINDEMATLVKKPKEEFQSDAVQNRLAELTTKRDELINKMIEESGFGKFAKMENGSWRVDFTPTSADSATQQAIARLNQFRKDTAGNTLGTQSAEARKGEFVRLMEAAGDTPKGKLLRDYYNLAVSQGSVPSPKLAESFSRMDPSAEAFMRSAVGHNAQPVHLDRAQTILEKGGDAAEGFNRFSGVDAKLLAHEGVTKTRPLAKEGDARAEKIADALATWVKAPEGFKKQVDGPDFASWAKDPDAAVKDYLAKLSPEARKLAEKEMEANKALLKVLCTQCDHMGMPKSSRACQLAIAG